MQNKKNRRQAQLDEIPDEEIDIDSLFKPDKDKLDIGDRIEDKEDHIEELASPEAMEVKKHIEKMDLSLDDVDYLMDCLKDKKSELTDDDIDTEMDREEAEEKDDMRKPLGEEAIGATSPGATSMMPASGATSPPITTTPAPAAGSRPTY